MARQAVGIVRDIREREAEQTPWQAAIAWVRGVWRLQPRTVVRDRDALQAEAAAGQVAGALHDMRRREGIES